MPPLINQKRRDVGPGYESIRSKDVIDIFDVLNGIVIIVYKIMFGTFVTGLIPSQLKAVVVTPIHKSGSKSDLPHHRPITTLSFLENIMEKYISNKLFTYCVTHSVFAGVQYGFMPNSKTERLLQQLVNDVYKALHPKMCAVVVFRT